MSNKPSKKKPQEQDKSWVKGFLDFVTGLKDLKDVTLVLVALLPVAIGIIALVKTNYKTVGLTILVVGFSVLWITAVYRLWGKKWRDLVRGPAFRKYQRIRDWVIVAGIPILILGVLFLLFHKRPSDKLIILVADFVDSNSPKSRVTENILYELRKETGKYGDISVVSLGEPIDIKKGSDEAKSKGKEKTASIVLWGWSQHDKESTVSHAHFELMLNKSPRDLALRSNAEKMVFQTAEPENITVQTELSKELAYLTLITIGFLRFEKQDYDSAIELFSRGLSQQVKGDKIAEPIVDPGDVYFFRALAYSEKKNSTKAIADYNQAIASYEKTITPDNQDAGRKSNLVSAYNNVGILYAESGDLTNAIAAYSQAIKYKSDFAAAHNNRGVALYSKRSDDPHNIDLALDDFNQALKDDPKSIEARGNRGMVYAEKGNLDLAFDDLNRAIAAKPDIYIFYYDRGIAYYKKEEPNLALDDYRRAIWLKSDFADAYFNSAVIYKERDEMTNALNNYDEVVRLKPDYADAYIGRAVVNLCLAHSDQAAADARSFLKLSGLRHELSPYAVIVGSLAYRQAHKDAESQAFLNQVSGQIDASTWPFEVIKYLLRKINARQLLMTARNNDQKTEAETYVGIDQYLSGQFKEAEIHLQWVKDNGNKKFEEYHMALAAIQLIKSQSQNRAP
jgi:tetratricopeptide (TPR) repeat protein